MKLETEEEQLEAVKQNEYYIKYITNPSEEVQLEAVKQDGWVIRYITNPCKKVKDMVKLMDLLR